MLSHEGQLATATVDVCHSDTVAQSVSGYLASLPVGRTVHVLDNRYIAKQLNKLRRVVVTYLLTTQRVSVKRILEQLV